MTLSYSVVRKDGNVEQLLRAQDVNQLASSFAPGMVLQGRYVLDRELGRGGMGMVFLGRDNRLDRPVAIKAILPSDSGWRARGLATEKLFQDRFLEEAKTGAKLTHPAIATVHDFGYHRDVPFTVFEYVSGPTLHELVRGRGRIPLEEVRLIIGPLAQALDFAHSRFVVHRDLKPANIKATEQGNFKILDLGLATEFRRQDNWAFCGTPAYASPEQAAGLPCDGRADQYALGVITYELLTGRRPFHHSGWRELLEMHRTQQPQWPKVEGAGLPAQVAQALLRSLEKDPARRFSACQGFALALGCQLLSEPTTTSKVCAESVAIRGGLSVFDLMTLWVPSWLRDSFHRLLWTRLDVLRGSSAIYLVLTNDSLWYLERGRVASLTLTAISHISYSAFTPWTEGATLTLGLLGPGKGRRSISFRLPTEAESQRWGEQIDALRSTIAPSDQAPATPLEAGPVAILRHRPQIRYQLLGPVEGVGKSRWEARASATVRGALIGANALVDIEEDRLSDDLGTRWSFSGSAVRAVDSQEREKLWAKWHDTQVSVFSHWSFLYLALLAIGGLCVSLALGFGALMRNLFVVIAWSSLIVLLLRLLRWPQLLKSASISLATLAVSAMGLTMFSLHRLWELHKLTSRDLRDLTDPGLLLLLLGWSFLGYGLFLAKRAGRLRREVLSVRADSGVRPPLVRRFVSSLSTAFSCLLVAFALLAILSQAMKASGIALGGRLILGGVDITAVMPLSLDRTHEQDQMLKLMYEELEQEDNRLLAEAIAGHGPAHPDVARILTHLATLSSEQGDYSKARSRLEEALRTWMRCNLMESPEAISTQSQYLDLLGKMDGE
jgi:serine/threonine-protein kinase